MSIECETHFVIVAGLSESGVSAWPTDRGRGANVDAPESESPATLQTASLTREHIKAHSTVDLDGRWL